MVSNVQAKSEHVKKLKKVSETVQSMERKQIPQLQSELDYIQNISVPEISHALGLIERNTRELFTSPSGTIFFVEKQIVIMHKQTTRTFTAS